MSKGMTKALRHNVLKGGRRNGKILKCSDCPLPCLRSARPSPGERDAAQPSRSGFRHFPPKADLYVEGESPQEFFVLFTGWAFRYKLLFDGSRQILDFILPGDPMGPPLITAVNCVDHSVETITDASVCVFSAKVMLDQLRTNPAVASRMVWVKASEEARAFARITALGRYTARQRVAHLLLEIFQRLRLLGGVTDMACEFPLTQNLLADTLGLSTVHVNRVLRQFREEGVATIGNHTLTIHRLDSLEEVCDYDRSYLGPSTQHCPPDRAEVW